MTKNILLCSLFLSFFTLRTDEAFAPRKITWAYTIQAKDASNLEDIQHLQDKINNFAFNVQRGKATNVYQKFLVFIKELKEAITAGLNLFGTVSTSQELLTDIVEGVVEEAINNNPSGSVTQEPINNNSSEVVAQEPINNDPSEVAAQENVNDNLSEVAAQEIINDNLSEETVVKSIKTNTSASIVLTCFVTEMAELETWNAATAKLQELANSLNHSTTSSEDIANLINEIYELLNQIPQEKSISLNLAE